MPGSTGGGTLPVPKKTNERRKSGGIHTFLTSLLGLKMAWLLLNKEYIIVLCIVNIICNIATRFFLD